MVLNMKCQMFNLSSQYKYAASHIEGANSGAVLWSPDTEADLPTLHQCVVPSNTLSVFEGS